MTVRGSLVHKLLLLPDLFTVDRRLHRRTSTTHPALVGAFSIVHWVNLITLIDFPQEIRNVIYNTNAIDHLADLLGRTVIVDIENRRDHIPNPDMI